jgi:hypothetical protein
MLALNAQAQAFQPSPNKTPSSAKVAPIAAEAPWKAALRLHLAPPDEPLGFVSGSPSNGHSATDALLNTARRFTDPTFHPTVYDWDPQEDSLVVSWKMPPHRFQRQERLVFKEYDLLAVGDQRRFPEHWLARHTLAKVGPLRNERPASPNASEEGGEWTPLLHSSGASTPVKETVVTPPESDDDILWIPDRRLSKYSSILHNSSTDKLFQKGEMQSRGWRDRRRERSWLERV